MSDIDHLWTRCTDLLIFGVLGTLGIGADDAKGHRLGVAGQLHNVLILLGQLILYDRSLARRPSCRPSFSMAYVCLLGACVAQKWVHTSLSLLGLATKVLRCHTTKRSFRSSRTVADGVCHNTLPSSTKQNRRKQREKFLLSFELFPRSHSICFSFSYHHPHKPTSP
jgi:hypothetical protein